MRITTTAILGVTMIALAIMIYFVDRKPETGKRAAAMANVLVRFDAAAVERIVIEKGVTKTVLTSQNGFWFFTEPEVDRVDAAIHMSARQVPLRLHCPRLTPGHHALVEALQNASRNGLVDLCVGGHG